jgi:hypothetical protein
MQIDSTTIVVGLAIYGGAKEFFSRIAGKIADKVGDDVADAFSVKLRTYRLKNWAEAVRSAHAQVEAAKREAKAIPPKVLIPLMEGASLEDDESMQARWASLLARAAVAGNADDIPPAYASILSQLTPLSATTLEILRDTRQLAGWDQDPGVYKTKIGDDLREQLGGRWVYNGAAEMYDRFAEAEAALDLLIRQGLAARTSLLKKKRPALQAGNLAYPEQLEKAGYAIYITELGRRFLAACQPLEPS